MRILVTGANGFVGRHISQALLAQGHELVLTSRIAHKNTEYQDWRVVDFSKALDPEDWREIVEGVDIAINAVGIFKTTSTQSFAVVHDRAPRALFAACQQAGVKRIIQISALGTDEGAVEPYHLSKKRADDSLSELGVEWVVLRPSLIIGGQGESWRFFKALASLPFVPIIADGAQPLQPVAISDVVKAVLAAIQRPEAAACRIDIVGAESVTLRNYLRALSSWLGRGKFISFSIPYVVAGALASVAEVFANMPLNRQAISLLKGARFSDGSGCRQKLGFTPAGLSDYLVQHPAGREQRFDSNLYFLGPLLRLTLAFMWIMAGVTSLFLYPRNESLALLAKLGLGGSTGEVALYGAALLDILIGLFLLSGKYIKVLSMLQVGLIVIYTIALSWISPEMWADPFGPLVKNIPIIVAIFIMQKLEE